MFIILLLKAGIMVYKGAKGGWDGYSNWAHVAKSSAQILYIFKNIIGYVWTIDFKIDIL